MDDQNNDQSMISNQQRAEENRRRLNENRLRREQVVQQQEEINRERAEATRQRLEQFRNSDKSAYFASKTRMREENKTSATANQQSDEFWLSWKRTEAVLDAKRRAYYEEQNRPYQEERQRLETIKHQKREERQQLLEKIYPMFRALRDQPAAVAKFATQISDIPVLTDQELEALLCNLEDMIRKPWCQKQA